MSNRSKDTRAANIYLANDPRLREKLLLTWIRADPDTDILPTFQTRESRGTSELQEHAVLNVENAGGSEQERREAEAWMAGSNSNKQKQHVQKSAGSRTLHIIYKG